jgi:hypothetical protein
MEFRRVEVAHGGSNYLKAYLIFMAITCVGPYFEENMRCLKVHLAQKKGAVV